MDKILLVDDEPDIVEFLQYNLKQEGFDVITAFDGLTALKMLDQKPDLILLDVMMTGMNGFEVCRKIRSVNDFKDVPVIFLTARSSEADEIAGLDIGANDYIRKPISPKKLVARVKANLRKTKPADYDSTRPIKVNAGPLYMDKSRYIVKVEGTEIIFPRKEFEILFYLSANPGIVFSRDDLLKEIWGEDVLVVDRTIDVHIRKIREKLEKHADLIETLKGVGYRFRSA